ncbi:energy-coupling factor transporter ATP-binding protein EcfA2 [Spinactinospora alkalitolerans]|uniref:Energy-coupling factor transporter ATP-binding protein EcfA2 n=1 Tax=Spinactinospora alkalitolerans TaxID=687207 RepID=A0A852TWT0_9ACTN|nr:ATP-binding protein [Spinactinospora alkalitolerans]NYE48398.1 energy-coupling factor transporter ATP-binding protein EcfA2 [Spinactinospora alkalitolerans]
MREPVRYCDAIRFLGADEERVIELIGRLSGGAGMIDLLQARTDLVRFAHRALNRLDREAHRLNRLARTRRVATAHTMIVVTALFESLDDTELPFELDGRSANLDAATTDASSPKHLGEFVALLVDSAPPLPRPQRPAADARTRVRRFYVRRCKQLPAVLRGMPVWGELGEAHRSAIADRLGSALAERCLRRYEELRDKLAASFPEFGAWANLHADRPRHAVLPEAASGLTRLRHQLQAISTGTVPDTAQAALARAHREHLVTPIAPLGRTATATHLPPLGIAYINPRFRTAEMGPTVLPHDPDWWCGATEVRDDLPEFLLGHLTSPRALTLPLVVFGPSGSGKSALARVLAARLPETDFAAVHVAARELAEDEGAAEIGDRLTRALTCAEGEATAGRDAVPLLVLDGLEELTTRAAVSRSELLAGLVEFQRERAAQGSPVAAVVTCRDATAARVRFPKGSVALHLEDFTDDQVAAWVETWNRVNASHFSHSGVRPLDAAALGPHMALARRPLLLLLLALYDGAGNALRRLSAPLRETALYERWLRMLADAADRADPAVTGRPDGADADPAVRTGRIEQGLLTASVMAFSMFNRGGWRVERDVVAADRALLVPWPAHYAPPPEATRLGCVVPAGEAGGGGETRGATEAGTQDRPARLAFSHPALGEYLVARLIAEELAGLAEARGRDLRAIRPSPPDDAFLHALLSFTPLSASGEIPRFLTERLRLLAPGVRDELRLVLAELLRGTGRARSEHHYAGYSPVPLPHAARDAAYSANLMLALVAVHGGAVPLGELFGPGAESLWRSLAHLWKSQLPPEQWASLVHALEVHRTGDGLVVHPCGPADPGGARPGPPGTQTDLGFTARESALLADRGAQRLLHAVEPLVRVFGGDVTARRGGAPSDANVLLTLAFGAADADDQALVAAYERAFSLAEDLGSDDRLRFQVFVLRQLRGHIHRLGARLVPLVTRHVRPLGVARSARASVRRLAEEHNEHVEAIRDVLAGRW